MGLSRLEALVNNEVPSLEEEVGEGPVEEVGL